MRPQGRTVAIVVIAVSAALGCSYTRPASVAPERSPMVVNAPVDQTWRAVIDHFADSNIPIRTIDRGSGLIATDDLLIQDPTEARLSWADCGSKVGEPVAAEKAVYNVRVRESGDTLSTVQITVRWSAPTVRDAWTDQNVQPVCVTTGTWEEMAERSIKERAERGDG